jgi:hypothetical protein
MHFAFDALHVRLATPRFNLAERIPKVTCTAKYPVLPVCSIVSWLPRLQKNGSTRWPVAKQAFCKLYMYCSNRNRAGLCLILRSKLAAYDEQ